MLSRKEINDVYQQHYIEGMGSVSISDAEFLCDIIKESQPTKCFEVGVASGMSTQFLLMALARLGPERELVSVDISQQYYFDPTKQVGYIVDLALPQPGCKFNLHTHQWAGDAETYGADEKFDYVFIDAHHGQPWPTIDAMLILPFVKPGTWIIFHDIALINNPKYSTMTGPFFAYDSFPGTKKKSQDEKQNIGAIQITENYRDYEDYLLASMANEWTLSGVLTERFSKRIFEMTERYYSESFAKQIRSQIETENQKIAAQQKSQQAS